MSEDYLSEHQSQSTKFTHGAVAADWGVNSAIAVAQSDDYSFAITDVVIDVQTDLTTEAATQPIPIRCTIYSNTNSADIIGLHVGVPNNCNIAFESPIIIPKSESYETRLQLGGATTATCDVYLLGYSCV